MICLTSSDKEGNFYLNLLFADEIPIFKHKDNLIEEWFNFFHLNNKYLNNLEYFEEWLNQSKNGYPYGTVIKSD